MGKKSGQRVQNSLNKNQVSSDLLGESTNSVIRAAGGIHQFCHQSCWGNPLIGNFSIRPTGGIHQFFHQSCWGNPSILSSELLGESTYWQFQHPTYWGNPPILSSELLGESINSVIRPTGGIHQSKQLCYVKRNCTTNGRIILF